MLLLKNEIVSEAVFTANVSFLLAAKTKKHALEQAVTEWNKANVQLDQITLNNENGRAKDFSVLHVEELDWYDAQQAEYSNQYRVHGRIRLSISEMNQKGYDINDFEQTSYQIPPNFVSEKPVLVISEGLRHLFLTLSQQSIEWKSLEESMPFSKLA
jgi:hypothetical protein